MKKIDSERTGAPAEPAPALYDLPFDQFQRYKLVADFVRLVRGETPMKVLDVGGYPGLIVDFLPEEDVTVVDVVPAEVPNYVQASGAELPFEDNSFDLVCSCDTLEHVPRENRAAFIGELTRVTKEFLYITAPFFDDRTRMAEEILYSYVERVLGVQFDTLKEHLDNGLPDFTQTLELLRGAGVAVDSFPSGYLYHWLPMMIFKHHLLARPDTDALHRRIDRFYNQNFYEDDFREPSYRRVIIGSKAGPAGAIVEFCERYKGGLREEGASETTDAFKLELISLMTGLLDQDLKKDVNDLVRVLRKDSGNLELEQARGQIAERDRRIVDLQNIIEAQNNSLDELHALVTKVRNLWPYRLYTKLRGRP